MKSQQPREFTFEPFVGALPLRFGMTASQVSELLGPPRSMPVPYRGKSAENREVVNVGYDTNGTLDSAVFLPESSLYYHGQDLFLLLDPIRFLREFDCAPVLHVGFVIFPKLGIRLSGYHDGDKSQQTLAVTCKGYYGRDLAKRSQPFI